MKKVGLFIKGYVENKIFSSRKAKVGLKQFVLENSNYSGKKLLSAVKTNNIVSAAIRENRPLMVGRFGATELNCCSVYEFDLRTKQEKAVKQLCEWSGFFPYDLSLGEKFKNCILEATEEVDLLGVWFLRFEDYFIKNYVPKESELSFLFDLEPWKNLRNPWTKELKGKRVLVIHPFTETIVSQYSKRTELFPSSDILPEFELITLKAVQTISGMKDDRFDTWFDALDYMYNQTLEIEYDVAILGCGAYGFPLAAKLKRNGKVAIHLGGVTQILFGIKGKRWEENPEYKYIKEMMNEHWVYPTADETPKLAGNVEGGCYWK